MAAKNPDYAIEDLYNSIEQGNFPSWTLYVQIMTNEEAKNYEFDPFDITKVWYTRDFPLIPVGKLVLNRNPENYFAEVEQVGFAPSTFVPGIGPSPDKLLQGRLLAYEDAHRYRLGVNHEQLPINAPKCPFHTKQRDGHATFTNGGSSLNYYPNSFEKVKPDERFTPPAIEVNGIIARHKVQTEDIDFVQAGVFYRKTLTDQERTNLISNIVNNLNGALEVIQYRQTALFYKADSNYGARVANGLGLDIEKVKSLSKMSQKERVKATTPR